MLFSVFCLHRATLLQNREPTYNDLASNEDHDATRHGRLEVHGVSTDFALREWQLPQFRHDGLWPLELLALKGQHAPILVQVAQPSAVALKQLIVVLQEGLAHAVCVCHPVCAAGDALAA